MADGRTHCGGFMDNKQHGYGCITNSNGNVQYGIWCNGEKIVMFTQQEAQDLQSGTYSLDSHPAFKTKVDDINIFMYDISTLSNKFEPFDDFNQNQAFFELKKESVFDTHYSKLR